MRIRLFASAMLLCCCSLAPLWADLESGPAVGEAVPPAKVSVVTGELAGQEVDYTAARADKSTIFVLIHADRWDRPVARFLRTLDRELVQMGGETAIVAIWLSDTPAETKDYLPRAQMSLNLGRTALTVFPSTDGPENWGLQQRASLTAVVARNGKVTARFGFDSVNETDVPKVTAALKASETAN